MEYPRRSIPSVSGLIAFEATARHLSFSRAAEELALTQGAVSKRVRQLETVLGLQLLLRNTNQVCLTETGQNYLGFAKGLLQQLYMSTENIRASAQGSDAVRVACPTEFAQRWLIPRLTGFSQAHPRCSINIMSLPSVDENRLAEADCVISDRQLPWRDTPTSMLASGVYVVVASPRHIRDASFLDPRDIAGKSLLTCNRTPDLWRRWFDGAGMAPQAFSEIRFDDAAVMIEAALAGQGIALVPDFLVADHIRSGQLRNLFPDRGVGRIQYRLAVQPSDRSRAAIGHFVRWITNAQRPTSDVGADHDIAAIGTRFNGDVNYTKRPLDLSRS